MQAVQKEQWHRNIPIIPLPLLPCQSVLYVTYPSHCLNKWCCFVFFYVDPVYFSSMGQCFCHIRQILLKGSSIQLQSWTRLFGVTEHRRLLLVAFWKKKKGKKNCLSNPCFYKVPPGILTKMSFLQHKVAQVLQNAVHCCPILPGEVTDPFCLF